MSVCPVPVKPACLAWPACLLPGLPGLPAGPACPVFLLVQLAQIFSRQSVILEISSI